MEVEEFRMFVHGPFATNIYIDARLLRKLKTAIARIPLFSFTEFCILKSLNSMTNQSKEQLINELKQETKISTLDVSSALKHLESTACVKKTTNILRGSAGDPGEQAEVESRRNAGLLKNLPGRKLLKRQSKDFFSITLEGKEKLDNLYRDYYEEIDQNSEIDIANENYLRPYALEEFWSEINAEKDIKLYRFANRLSLNQEGSFFTDEDLPVLLAIFRSRDFCKKLSLETNSPEAHLEFKDNIIYIYSSGVGIFSSQVTVRYSDDIKKIKGRLEEEVNRIIRENLKDQGLEEKLKNSISLQERFKVADIDNFKLKSAKVTSFAWTHIIYWFYGNRFFKDDETGDSKQTLIDNFQRDFTDLLEQPPENTSLFLRNRLAFYGWGRSLLLTDKRDGDAEKWVRNKVNLVEVGQYSCFGYILLDYLLQRVLLDLTVQKPVVEQSDRQLKQAIKLIDDVRPAVSVFLEEFQCGINSILHAGEPSLVKTLESQWRLDRMEESIRNKLGSLNNERSAREQSVITEKQDRMNIISSAFTIMGIAGVTAAILTLSPLSTMTEEQINIWAFFKGEIFKGHIIAFIITTIVIIGLAITIIFKWHDIKAWIDHKIGAWKDIDKNRKEMKRAFLKLEEGRYKKEEYYKELGKLRRKAKDLFDKGKISRSQHDKLKKEIEQYLEKSAL